MSKIVEGMQIGGYRMLRQIGEGGMGAVWMAEHAMLGRRAAIKVLHPSYSANEDAVSRFFDEARAATTIANPGIIQIFDVGRHVDSSAYIVMELLEGEPLDRRLQRLGQLAVGDALRICRQVASAVGAAHERGITHRDLKPENIFLVRDPEVMGGERAKILDFGIAKLAGELSKRQRTSASVVMGTPLYMSPEQCRGAGRVDQRADVYSLGCVLFTLVAGRAPFNAEGVGEIIVQHLMAPPPRVSEHCAGVPPEVDSLILRCLAKDPAERFASGAELASAIDALVGASSSMSFTPVSLRTVARSPSTTTLGSSAAVVTPSPATLWRRGRVYAGITALAVVGGAGVASVVSWGSAEDPALSVAPAANDPSPASSSPPPPPPQPPPPPPPSPPPPSPPLPTSPPEDLRSVGREEGGHGREGVAAATGRKPQPLPGAPKVLAQPAAAKLPSVSVTPAPAPPRADRASPPPPADPAPTSARTDPAPAPAPDPPAPRSPPATPAPPPVAPPPGIVDLDGDGIPDNR